MVLILWAWKKTYRRKTLQPFYSKSLSKNAIRAKMKAAHCLKKGHSMMPS